MSFPNYAKKYGQKAVISPNDFLDYLKSRGWKAEFPLPEGVILSYHPHLFRHIKEHHETVSYDSALGALHLLPETGCKVGVIPCEGFIGAPYAATRLEEYAALGCKRFVSIGTAGSLQKSIKIGDLVVCERAIRDEGTSHHYVKPAKYAEASSSLTSRIKRALDAREAKYVAGTSWTTDAPYRETVAEAKQYQEEGVATVEMEAAALFAVGAYRKVEVGALFSVSDSLADFEWKPAFHSKRTKRGLEFLYEVAVAALRSDEAS